MGIRNWWKHKSGAAKATTIFALLLTLQIGVCFSTDAMMPLYTRMFGPSQDSEWGLGLVIMQGFGCIFTFVCLLVALVTWLTGSNQNRRREEDSND